jgi:putative Mn2+ efflux pump MntP
LSAGTGIKLALLILSLGLDTFAVAVALGISGVGGRNRVRAAAGFALFEGLMPLVGFFLGAAVSGVGAEIATVAGIVVLFGVGAWMIWESISGDDDREPAVETLGGLVLTALSVSMDELAVGFSMGALGLPVGLAVALIAAQAFGVTLLGMALGNRIGEHVAERGETVAGVVLCGLALVLAVQQARGG